MIKVVIAIAAVVVGTVCAVVYKRKKSTECTCDENCTCKPGCTCGKCDKCTPAPVQEIVKPEEAPVVVDPVPPFAPFDIESGITTVENVADEEPKKEEPKKETKETKEPKKPVNKKPAPKRKPKK